MHRNNAPETPTSARSPDPVTDAIQEIKPDRIQEELTDGLKWRLALASLLEGSALAHMLATVRDNAATHTVELTLSDREAVVRLVALDAE